MIQIPRVGPLEPFLEGWTVLAALAAVTSLCTAVGYRNPAHLAKIELFATEVMPHLA
jgi:hypothetical protein